MNGATGAGFGESWLAQLPLRSLLARGSEMATACTSQREAHRAQESRAQLVWPGSMLMCLIGSVLASAGEQLCGHEFSRTTGSTSTFTFKWAALG